MVRRYNLRRSDNSPFVGQAMDLVTVDGTTKVSTGFPVTSAIVSHVSGVPTSALRIVSETAEQDLQADVGSSPLNMTFSGSEPIIVHSLGIDFSRGTLLRQFDISVVVAGVTVSHIAESSSIGRHIFVDGPFILSVGDSVSIFADIDESLKSSSSVSTESSASTLDMDSSLSSQSLSSLSSQSISSLSSESLSSQTISLSSSLSSLSSETVSSESSASSSSMSSEKSSVSSISSVSSLSSLSSLSSKSSSSKNSSSSNSSSHNSESSSSSPQTSSSSQTPSTSSKSSQSSVSSESSMSSSSESSSSSTGHLRAVGWIKYSPCTIQYVEYGGPTAVDEAVGLSVDSYLEDGFLVSITGIAAPTIVRFSYLAV